MSRQSDRMPPAMEFFFKFIFPLIFILVGGAVAYKGFHNLNEARESPGWPTVPGKIVSSGIERQYSGSSHNGGSSVTYHAEILYEFKVDGVTHNGNRVAFGDYGSSNPSHARSIANLYPQGKAVTVHYMPGTPDECVLEPGIKGQAFFVPAIGSLFFVAGCVMAVFLPRLINNHRTL